MRVFSANTFRLRLRDLDVIVQHGLNACFVASFALNCVESHRRLLLDQNHELLAIFLQLIAGIRELMKTFLASDKQVVFLGQLVHEALHRFVGAFLGRNCFSHNVDFNLQLYHALFGVFQLLLCRLSVAAIALFQLVEESLATVQSGASRGCVPITKAWFVLRFELIGVERELELFDERELHIQKLHGDIGVFLEQVADWRRLLFGRMTFKLFIELHNPFLDLLLQFTTLFFEALVLFVVDITVGITPLVVAGLFLITRKQALEFALANTVCQPDNFAFVVLLELKQTVDILLAPVDFIPGVFLELFENIVVVLFALTFIIFELRLEFSSVLLILFYSLGRFDFHLHNKSDRLTRRMYSEIVSLGT